MTTARAIIDAIKGEAAIRFGVSVNDIDSHKRQRPITRARQACMAVALEKVNNSSLNSIGAIFKRDHTTVIHARDTTAQREKEDPEYPAILNAMRARADLERKYWKDLVG